MVENNQLSGNMKNSSTGTSSTDASSETIGKHENEIVPHKISNHDKLVQTMVMVDGEWVNVNDTNDQANMKDDMNKVNKKVVEAQKGIVEAKSAADSAAKAADSAVSASVVNSDAITAQSAAISEAKSAISSANAAIQQTAATAASDAAKIRADVAQMQSEIDTNKTANSASVEALKSDISAAKQDLADVHDSLTKAQAAAEESQKTIGKSIAQINSDIEQGRKDIASAQQANADTVKQLDTYSKQAQDQGKTIKSIQDKQDGFTATLADVQGNVTQVSDKVDGLSASLKDAQDNVASVKAQADQLSATLTDHAKSIATLTASAKELSSTLEDADGRLSKVEQTAQTNSSTLSDVQGDLSQVKQDATTLTANLKDAQGNISTLQQKADSVSARLASAQGDIASLQTDVTGIKATLVSHEGDIHTLQADSKTLKDDMQDAQGDISTLKKTSTDVTAELQDHAGRISKAEQTASTLTNEFSDQDGRLSKVEQTATGTQQTVANQQGQINSIQTDAAGIHETLTGQGNQIANINVTLNGLNTKYKGVSGDLNNLKSQAQWATVTSAVDLNNVKTPCHEFLKGTVTNAPNESAWWYLTVEGSEGNRITQTVIADQSNNRYTRRWADGWSAWVKDATQTDVTALSNRITTNSTQITQNKQAIALKADQSTVNNLSGEVSQAQAQLKVQAGQISSKVSSTDFQTLNGSAMQNRGTVDSPDFNSLTQAGFYTITNPSGGKNYPTGSWGTLEVSGQVTDGNGRLNQKYVSDNGGITYTRQYNAGAKSWTSWAKVANQNDIDTLNGEITKNITAIQKNATAIDQTNKQISLKADQTEVDKVKNTATQNSSRLDVMAGQISSKVTSTDVNNIVNGKGYATTSTVQSLITQKAGTINENITNLDAKYKAKDGVNLATGTGNVNASGGYGTNGNIGGISLDTINDLRGKHITISVDVEWKGWKSGNQNRIGYELQINYDDGSVEYDGSWLTPTTTDGKQRITATYKLKDQHIKSLGEGYAYVQINCSSAKISHLKIERGTVATPWTPAPIDNATVTQVQQLTASIDGIQSTVANKADKSQITQLSNVIQSKVSTSDFTSKVSQLSNDINARVTKGDLLSQINVEAGRTLIQSNKIYFDADSFVMSPNSKAFIPSAFITNLSADKITTGTLDASKLHVKNFSANDIEAGTLTGIDILSKGENGKKYEMVGSQLKWSDDNKHHASIGQNEFSNNYTVDPAAFSFLSDNGIFLGNVKFNDKGEPDVPTLGLDNVSVWLNSNGVQLASDAFHVLSIGEGQSYYDTIKGETYNTQSFEFDTTNTVQINLNPGSIQVDPNTGQSNREWNSDSQLRIQKDDHIGAYFGTGNNGNQINFAFGGSDGGLNVSGGLHVSGSKNSVVQTSQGWLAINAYETAEYYFGDIGESNTGDSGQVVIGIDRIFNETVNTNVQYQVFITPYSDAHVWVEQRHNNRFVVKSDKPNAEFGWELKAKRKGYEDHRLRKVDADFKPLSVLNKGDF